MSSIVETGTKALGFLEKAVKSIAPFGGPAPDAEAPIVALINDLQVVDETKALVIAKTLQHSAVFNAVVRDQIAEMKTGSRYEQITKNFDSIIEDSMLMLKQIEENKNGFKEKIGRTYMKLTRGSIHTRFDKIKGLYDEVTTDTKGQLDRELMILEAYLDFRSALKEAEIFAAQIFKAQSAILDGAKADLLGKNAEVEAATDPEAKARAQLARDETQRVFDKENNRFDLCKMVSENLTIAYNVGDTVIANLNSTRSIKQSVYNKAVTFFTANEFAFTSIDATMTATAGLHESTQTVNALGDGMNRSLEALATISPKVKMAALQAAHGSNIKAESVRKLIESMVQFQKDAKVEVKRLRIESEQNTRQIAQIVDEGKDTLAKLAAQVD